MLKLLVILPSRRAKMIGFEGILLLCWYILVHEKVVTDSLQKLFGKADRLLKRF
jgi:hypothetical protein